MLGCARGHALPHLLMCGGATHEPCWQAWCAVPCRAALRFTLCQATPLSSVSAKAQQLRLAHAPCCQLQAWDMHHDHIARAVMLPDMPCWCLLCSAGGAWCALQGIQSKPGSPTHKHPVPSRQPRLSVLPSPAPLVLPQVELARSFGRGRGGPPPPPRSSRRYDDPPPRGGGYGGSGGGSSYATAPKSSGYRVIVTGLPKSASWQDLKDHFRRVGEVTFTQVWLSPLLVEYAHWRLSNLACLLAGSEGPLPCYVLCLHTGAVTG